MFKELPCTLVCSLLFQAQKKISPLRQRHSVEALPGGGGGGKTGRLSEFTVAGPPCVCVVDDYT